MITLNDTEYTFLKEKLFKLTKLDLDGYKSQQIRRRLNLYINKQENETIFTYCHALENEPDKVRNLLDFLAINVSEFFRDSEHFDVLRNHILPDMMKRTPRLNLWSAACSAGQEAYSLALIMENYGKNTPYRILATDIDESALNQAKNGGPYTKEDVRRVEPPMLAKWFTIKPQGYTVADKLRYKVDFRHFNLLNDSF
ncbi:MAG: hypothetical protein PHE50_06815, partial [Dehalococcoidales bacterium]|nr:hypothetical protein [Dehalococcoidales bacterium]